MIEMDTFHARAREHLHASIDELGDADLMTVVGIVAVMKLGFDPFTGHRQGPPEAAGATNAERPRELGHGQDRAAQASRREQAAGHRGSTG